MSILSVTFFLVFTSFSWASAERYSCDTSYAGPAGSKFEVTEEKPGENREFKCKVQTSEGKKIFSCEQPPGWPRDIANPVYIYVNYGSDLYFRGQRGQQPDPWDGYIWPGEARIHCSFSK